MKIGTEQQYMIHEFEHGILLTAPGVGLRMPGAQRMVLATREDLVEYLGHYLSLRESGVPFASAHEQALIAARIPKGQLLHG